MTDPFIMLVLIAELGDDYIIWDKESRIEFRIATTGAVSATHSVSKERIDEIRQTCLESPIYPQFTIDITDAKGKLVARVHKTLYVKKRPRLLTSTTGSV